MYSFGNDENFVNVTSLTKAAFAHLLEAFMVELLLLNYVHNVNGRPKTFKYPHQILGLILVFYCSTMDLKTICQLFGSPPSTTSRMLKFAEKVLMKTLITIPEAQVKWPTLQQQIEWGQLVQNKNELIVGRWGFIDGKNYHVQKPSQAELENAHYNGWLHTHIITGTLCFGVDGTICWGKHNFAGSWNDGEMSRDFFINLSEPEKNVEGHGVLSDSAFPVTSEMYGKIMTPLKSGELEATPQHLRYGVSRMSEAITSLRQACEWGMGSVEKVYRQLLLPLPFDKCKRQRRITNIHLLFNYRVRTTSINQIRTYFNAQ
jgi:hypothetical protein